MNYQGASLTFSSADPKDAEYLTQFAMDANSIYQYRTVSDAEAKKVFLLSHEDFNIHPVVTMSCADEIIGFYSLKIPHMLGHLFIKPSKIRCGFGALLFHKAMEHARTLGWKYIEWESDPNAANFYKKMGAVQIGTRPCRLNPPQNIPYFRYSLASK